MGGGTSSRITVDCLLSRESSFKGKSPFEYTTIIWAAVKSQLKQYVIVIVCAGNNRQYRNISTAFTHFFNLQHSGENNSVLLAKLPLFSSPCHT
ncbi:hypothetical protein POPTR_016G114550v4 [Populus trichocarpa]|uniref:Uncharacterized protein n=1 Tax=Populus trichocarpa TaxID=3694 RepID=A0ACC0RUN8_POPTR|nr:hypothetical protein POPTR_016G114550v4 [Populus trichocarpa]